MYKNNLDRRIAGTVNGTSLCSNSTNLSNNDLGTSANGDGNWGSCINKVSNYLISLEL
ncbi:hypothetical protein [Arsenophonus apicola]|uniref:Uncharacterized protein n=1 Tax=Arsenophonus apicola TaxID=2879119 RepID=A0ABY8P0J2_9GAMM|nr:hypothetical protein [Arsenophonus apicola]WGO82996.1 hypothetical protein QG404_11675 [Arsenophonus apicola]